MSNLTPLEKARYSRHLILPEVGAEGQERLKGAKVALVGLGGLGAPQALYLAAAGVGTLGLVDFDLVDLSNLQRQVIHFTPDVGKPKLASAKEKIEAVNPHVRVVRHEEFLTSENALDILAGYDVVVDGTDNFPTRYLVNDACVLLNKPNVYGSIFRFEGQVTVFYAKEGPCYRCLFPAPPPPGTVPNCAEGGVLGILPGVIGSLQATECIKWILRKGESLLGRLLLYDALTLKFRELKINKDPSCPICGDSPSIHGLIDYEAFCGNDVETESSHVPIVTVSEVSLSLGDLVLVDVREAHEVEIAQIKGSRLIPLGQLVDRMGELNPEQNIVVYCRSGIRSAQAVRILMKHGFRRVRSLEGGILAWADEVDPTMAKY